MRTENFINIRHLRLLESRETDPFTQRIFSIGSLQRSQDVSIQRTYTTLSGHSALLEQGQ
jgi:hypothetical protein